MTANKPLIQLKLIVDLSGVFEENLASITIEFLHLLNKIKPYVESNCEISFQKVFIQSDKVIANIKDDPSNYGSSFNDLANNLHYKFARYYSTVNIDFRFDSITTEYATYLVSLNEELQHGDDVFLLRFCGGANRVSLIRFNNKTKERTYADNFSSDSTAAIYSSVLIEKLTEAIKEDSRLNQKYTEDLVNSVENKTE